MCYEKVENGTFQSGVLLGPKDSQRLVLIPLAFFGSFTVFPFKGIFIFDCIHASTPMLLENTPHHKGATTMSIFLSCFVVGCYKQVCAFLNNFQLIICETGEPKVNNCVHLTTSR